MANSTRKPRKTNDTLTPRGDGRWCKRYRCGEQHSEGSPAGEHAHESRWWYFRGSEVEALLEWQRVKPYLLAGREPPPLHDTRPKIADVVNHFLTFKKSLVVSGEISERTWNEYDATCKLLVEYFGRDYVIEDIAPTDWQTLRAKMSDPETGKGWGPVRLHNEIQRVRSVFKYAFGNDIIDRPVKFGDGFKKPSAEVLRKNRTAKGSREFTAVQIRAILKVAPPKIKAMVLLAINGGMGPNDLATLTITRATASREFLDYPRPKTGIERRIPLWPETVAAIHAALAVRPKPKNPADAELLFIAGRGASYVCRNGGYKVAQEFRLVLAKASISGRAFYDFRRTFETVGDNFSRDRDATKAIMGHSFGEADMSNRYRQGFYDARLKAVTDCVHAWLFGRAKPAAKKTSRAKRPTGDATPLRVFE